MGCLDSLILFPHFSIETAKIISWACLDECSHRAVSGISEAARNLSEVPILKSCLRSAEYFDAQQSAYKQTKTNKKPSGTFDVPYILRTTGSSWFDWEKTPKGTPLYGICPPYRHK